MVALQAHRGRMADEGQPTGHDDLIFPSRRGGWTRRPTFNKSFHQILSRTGLPDIRPHDLRHTHASLLLAAGVNPKVVSERLGHATIVVTLGIYSHVMPGLQEQAADAIATALSEPTTAPEGQKRGA